MPRSGKATIGSSAVTSMSTASVSHQVAIQTIMARVARPARVNSTHSPDPVEYWLGSREKQRSASGGPAPSPMRRTVAALSPPARGDATVAAASGGIGPLPEAGGRKVPVQPGDEPD